MLETKESLISIFGDTPPPHLTAQQLAYLERVERIYRSMNNMTKERLKGLFSILDNARRRILYEISSLPLDAPEWKRVHLENLKIAIGRALDDFERKFIEELRNDATLRSVLAQRRQALPIEQLKEYGIQVATPHISTDFLQLLYGERGESGFAVELIKGLTDDARKRIATTLTLGSMGDKSTTDIMNEIGRNLTDPSIFKDIKTRAEVILRTEINRVASLSDIYSIMAIGQQIESQYRVKIRKMWITAQDERVRPSHARLHGKILFYDEKFVVGGFQALAPHDPNLPAKEVIQCRCMIQALPLELKEIEKVLELQKEPPPTKVIVRKPLKVKQEPTAQKEEMSGVIKGQLDKVDGEVNGILRQIDAVLEERGITKEIDYVTEGRLKDFFKNERLKYESREKAISIIVQDLEPKEFFKFIGDNKFDLIRERTLYNLFLDLERFIAKDIEERYLKRKAYLRLSTFRKKVKEIVEYRKRELRAAIRLQLEKPKRMNLDAFWDLAKRLVLEEQLAKEDKLAEVPAKILHLILRSEFNMSIEYEERFVSLLARRFLRVYFPGVEHLPPIEDLNASMEILVKGLLKGLFKIPKQMRSMVHLKWATKLANRPIQIAVFNDGFQIIVVNHRKIVEVITERIADAGNVIMHEYMHSLEPYLSRILQRMSEELKNLANQHGSSIFTVHQLRHLWEYEYFGIFSEEWALGCETIFNLQTLLEWNRYGQVDDLVESIIRKYLREMGLLT
jgi:hypothetical protein